MQDELLKIENELAGGDGDAYRRHLAGDAVVIVPGAVLGREECAAAIDASPGWDEYEITGVRCVELGPAAALLTYRWRSRRGEQPYSAAITSVYAQRDGTWKLVLHQQTPEPG